MNRIYMILAIGSTSSWIPNGIWAFVALVFLVLFRAQLGRFIDGLAKFSFEWLGIKLSLDRKHADATAELTAASAMRSDHSASAREVAETVRRAVPRAEARRLSHASILWVDDCPENNIHERRAFEAIGLEITLARDTDEADEIRKHQRFSAIISNMGRGLDTRAGYTLLKAIRDTPDQTPFVIYSTSNAPEHKREAEEKGAQGSTNDPRELFTMVTRAIIHRA